MSKIARISYLLQNFRKAIVQNRDPSDANPDGGRPCRAEIRWYGATDEGLIDVRDDIRLWGLECEKQRMKELLEMNEYKNKTKIELADIILSERWDLKMRRELYRTIHNMEYDGGE